VGSGERAHAAADVDHGRRGRPVKQRQERVGDAHHAHHVRREDTPSAQVVSALTRALRITRDERDHLYRLAGLEPPRDGRICDHIPPGMQRVLNRLGDTPVSVFTAD
jgi:hypothetical protein